MNDSERLVAILEHLGKRKNTLAKELGYINSGILNHILHGRNGISPTLASKICTAYPEINKKWLLTGKGTMIKDNKSDLDDANFSIEQQLKGIYGRLEKIEQQGKTIEELKEKIQRLEKKLLREKRV